MLADRILCLETASLIIIVDVRMWKTELPDNELSLFYRCK